MATKGRGPQTTVAANIILANIIICWDSSDQGFGPRERQRPEFPLTSFRKAFIMRHHDKRERGLSHLQLSTEWFKAVWQQESDISLCFMATRSETNVVSNQTFTNYWHFWMVEYSVCTDCRYMRTNHSTGNQHVLHIISEFLSYCQSWNFVHSSSAPTLFSFCHVGRLRRVAWRCFGLTFCNCEYDPRVRTFG